MERRRCNHHTLEQPLSTLECLSSVVDPKGSRTNKNRYIVASQEEVVRKYCRAIKGVPLVYIKRSVMVMEPMADSTLGAREGFEKGKFRAGIRGKDTGIGHKRKRAEDESSENEESGGEQADEAVIEDAKADGDIVAKKKKSRGPKGPNPLSVRKPQNRKEAANMVKIHGARGMEVVEERAARADKAADIVEVADVVEALEGEQPEVIARRKRKRKHKPSGLKELLQVGGIDEESS